MASNKRFRQIMAAGVLLLLVGLYFLYTQISKAGDRWPSYRKPGTLTVRIDQLNREIEKHRSDIAKIPAARDQLAALRVEYELATRVLPRESSPDQLIAAIRTKALQAGVVPDRLAPTVSSAGGGSFEVWSFTLSIRGNYDQIATFINKMEEFESNDPARVGSEKRFFRVENIEIAAEQNGLARLGGTASDASEKPGHQCSLTMQTYRYTGQQ